MWSDFFHGICSFRLFSKGSVRRNGAVCLRRPILFCLARKEWGEKRRWNDFYSASRLNSLAFSLSALIDKLNQPIETAADIRPYLLHIMPHGMLQQNAHAVPAEYLSGRSVKLHCRRRGCNHAYFESVHIFRSTLHGSSFTRDRQCNTC